MLSEWDRHESAVGIHTDEPVERYIKDSAAWESTLKTAFLVGAGIRPLCKVSS